MVRLATSFAYVRREAEVGNFDPVSGAWTIGPMGAGSSVTLRIFATADQVGTFTNTAKLSGGLEFDFNSHAH